MASDKDLVQYITDQCAGAGTITTRLMFGDYALYCEGKVVGLICDDQLYVKPTAEGRALLREEVLAPPYEGARDYFRIDDLDDHAYLAALVGATCRALPEPRPKKKKKQSYK